MRKETPGPELHTVQSLHLVALVGEVEHEVITDATRAHAAGQGPKLGESGTAELEAAARGHSGFRHLPSSAGAGTAGFVRESPTNVPLSKATRAPWE